MGSLTAILAGGALLAPTSARAQNEGVEELTRGPVHEAFASTVNYDPEPGIFVSTEPPELIEEVPPDQQPEGENVAWIPGYWGWEEETSDFLWISGVWRNLPPGRQWVPGYWGENGDQWQWTSGYWADEATEQVTYLSKPPQSLESGPSIKAPSNNHIWISGSWINREDRYAWRPGYWEMGQQDWAWTPAHYLWTPRGYVFVEGYWDYDVPRRGVVFAPVRIRRDYYERPNYSYTPAVVIALNVFVDHLFVRPRHGHYYFGDYYEPRYQREGIIASFSYRSNRGGYDPLYAQSRWQHRNDREWENKRRDNYDYYRSNEDARPPRTWAAFQSRPEDRRRDDRGNYQFAQPLQKYVSNTKEQRFQNVSIENKTKIIEKNKLVQNFAQDRRKMENRPNDKASEGSDKRIQAKQEKIARSPLAGKSMDQFSGKNAPPKVPVSKISKEQKAKDAANAKSDKMDELKKSAEQNKQEKQDKKEADSLKKSEAAQLKKTEAEQRRNAEPSKGKDKSDKKSDPNMPPDQKRDGKPESPTLVPSDSKTKDQNSEKGKKAEKSDNKSRTPNGESNTPNNSPTKPTVALEPAPKNGRSSERKMEQPQQQRRTAPPETSRKSSPEPSKKSVTPEPTRKAEPKPQKAPSQPKQQKAQSEPKQPKPQPESKQQRARPEPKPQPAPPQARPEQAPKENSSKKKEKGEDTDSKKKRD